MSPTRRFILTSKTPLTTWDGMIVRSTPCPDGSWRTMVRIMTPDGSTQAAMAQLEADANIISYKIEV